MDRRQYLKTIGITAVSAGVVADACKTETKKTETAAAGTESQGTIDRMPQEKASDDAIKNQPKFFTPEEFSTITILGDIIIPKDDVSGSASDAKVADFIEFIVKDDADLQTPLRGGSCGYRCGRLDLAISAVLRGMFDRIGRHHRLHQRRACCLCGAVTA